MVAQPASVTELATNATLYSQRPLLAERLVEVIRLSALSWDAARLVAAHALREGRDRVDIALAVGDPGDLPRKVRILSR